jgi:hypothetical protein
MYQMFGVPSATQAETHGFRGSNLHLARIVPEARVSCEVRIIATHIWGDLFLKIRPQAHHDEFFCHTYQRTLATILALVDYEEAALSTCTVGPTARSGAGRPSPSSLLRKAREN